MRGLESSFGRAAWGRHLFRTDGDGILAVIDAPEIYAPGIVSVQPSGALIEGLDTFSGFGQAASGGRPYPVWLPLIPAAVCHHRVRDAARAR